MKALPCRVWFLATVALLWTSQMALGQGKKFGTDPNADAGGAAACSACCGGTALMIILAVVIPLVIVVLNIVLLIWVARDAKNRNMDSAVVWMLLVMFTGPLGLIIYLFSRPEGNLISCRRCGNSRLQASKRCPHCGNA